MKKYFILAAAALTFAACTNDEILPQAEVQQAVDDGSVKFDVYTSRGLTRAGDNGVINDATLQGLGSSGYGFGVFGYYTNGESYAGNTKPNFFYNQNVYYNSSSLWYYAPVKYWPNEFGNDAISDQVDKLTFFAYAPWVDVDPLTGIVKDDQTNNIISMTRNNVTGDPFIRYSATMDPTNSTDLCYGVAAEDFTSSNSAVNVNNIKKGFPYKNVVKPGTDAKSKIKFDFKHALAQLKVTINADVNDQTNGSPETAVQTDYTRIWVRSITFEGITQQGALNLNSTGSTPEWYDINGVNKITTGSLTVYDGLKDGKEPMEKASTETPATFNADLIQSEKYTFDVDNKISNTIMGVTDAEKPLFKGGSNIVFAIPTGEKMKVTIVYDVETVDPNLAYYLSDGETQGSTIENKITKTVDAFGLIKAGYCYNLQIHLGMRTVDFDAVVTEWQDINAETYLPNNLPTFALSKTDVNRYVRIPATSIAYDFAVSGLPVNGTPVVDNTHYNGGGTVTVSGANASGVALGNISATTANTTTAEIYQGYIEVKDPNDFDNHVYIRFTQSAAPIGFTTLTYASDVLTCIWTGASEYANTAAFAAGGTIKVYKNGVDITSDCDLTDATNKTIGVPLGTKVGDVYKVTLQANQAPMESKTITIATI